ncbi:cupin-like domain-containing protein [uncultured Nostoc sp.]|uniref:cupin-like domain-containing protein n=1 Tax=uncultured Nostoc sp. TaxID=340711 RepID=UPI0035CB8324
MSLANSSYEQLDLLAPAPKFPSTIIKTDTPQFRKEFNLSSFMFSHNLAGHPLFEIPRLVELANTILGKGEPAKVACQVGQIPVNLKWSQVPRKDQVLSAIARIEESGSWILLKSVQLDPEYNTLLNQIVVELEELTGVPLRKEITWLDAYIFIASPHSITPYHIDHESNFLFQIHGDKDVNLFNPRDRSVLTEKEIEQYYIGQLDSANYTQEKQTKASVYHLTPGKAVHHPVLAPHWVKNGSNVSVSLSINFCMRSFDLQARVYQINHYLRKLGLEPTPPGQSAIKDYAKILALGILSKRQPKNKFELLRSGVKRLNGLEKSVLKVSSLFHR